jgi:hypothetical protein
VLNGNIFAEKTSFTSDVFEAGRLFLDEINSDFEPVA